MTLGYGTRNGNENRKRMEPPVPVKSKERIMKQAFTYHNAILGEAYLLVVKQDPARHLSHGRSAFSDTVCKQDEHVTRSVDRNDHLDIIGFEKCPKQRNRDFNAAINIQRLLKIAVEGCDKLANAEPQMRDRKRTLS